MYAAQVRCNSYITTTRGYVNRRLHVQQSFACAASADRSHFYLSCGQSETDRRAKRISGRADQALEKQHSEGKKQG